MITAFIQAKSKNERCPGKHTRVIGGRRLIEHVIDHALAAITVDNVYLFTDGEELAGIARDKGIGVIDEPEELTRCTTQGPLIDYRMKDWERRHGDPEGSLFVNLYGNIPVLPPGLIDRAVSVAEERGCGKVVSMFPITSIPHPFDARTITASGNVECPYIESDVRVRGEGKRQTDFYFEDGGVTIHRWPYEPEPVYPVMTDSLDVFEVDTERDVRIAEMLLNADLYSFSPSSGTRPGNGAGAFNTGGSREWVGKQPLET